MAPCSCQSKYIIPPYPVPWREKGCLCPLCTLFLTVLPHLYLWILLHAPTFLNVPLHLWQCLLSLFMSFHFSLYSNLLQWSQFLAMLLQFWPCPLISDISLWHPSLSIPSIPDCEPHLSLCPHLKRCPCFSPLPCLWSIVISCQLSSI